MLTPKKKRNRKGSGARAKAAARSHAGQAPAARGGQARLHKKVHVGSKVVLAPKIGTQSRKKRPKAMPIPRADYKAAGGVAHTGQSRTCVVHAVCVAALDRGRYIDPSAMAKAILPRQKSLGPTMQDVVNNAASAGRNDQFIHVPKIRQSSPAP